MGCRPQAAISLGIDDLLTAPSKDWLIQDAEQQEEIVLTSLFQEEIF